MHLAGPFAMLGHRFDVACPDAGLAAELTAVLVTCADPGPADARYSVVVRDAVRDVHVDEQLIGYGVRPEDVVDLVCTQANSRAVASADAPLVLHAGAVERDGAALVVVGESGVGKTTLVARLVEDGWGYLTDEAVRVTAGLDALPYPKPLVVKEDGPDGVVRRHRPVAGRICDRPVPVGGVVLLGVEAVTPGEEVVGLAKLAFPASAGAAGLDLAARLVRERTVVVLPARPDRQVADEVIDGLRAGWAGAVAR